MEIWGSCGQQSIVFLSAILCTVSKATDKGFGDIHFNCIGKHEDSEDRSSSFSGNSSGSDCFEKVGDKTLWIANGSSTVDVTCAKRITCLNGEIVILGEYNCSSSAVCEMRNGVHKCHCVSGFQGDGEICSSYSNCADVFNDGHTTDGIYAIIPSNWSGRPFHVYCNMSQGGGWTVFQRRVDGDVDFYRNWNSYKYGFGDLHHEFWLGNEKLHYITNQSNYTLRIDLIDTNGAPHYAEYDKFRISNESDDYRLSELGTYDGTAGIYTFSSLSNQRFSTFDSDSDHSPLVNCAVNHRGAWWYSDCGHSNLNGEYDGDDGALSDVKLIHPNGNTQSIRFSEMKMRPRA